MSDARIPTVTESSAYHLGRQQGAIDCLGALDELHRFMTGGETATLLTDDGAAVLITLRARLTKVRDEATAAKASIDGAIAVRPA